VVFAKNSDRPEGEVQEVVALPAAAHAPGAALRCTHVSIPQAPATRAVLLSKPTWMWGAEMAVNSDGVAVGNEAVWTNEPLGGAGLLGVDLVRLAAERSGSAEEAVGVITGLLEAHGQGGGCEEGGEWSYHNGFVVADRREAWVVEAAGRYWAAERLAPGSCRNISNCLSIRTRFHRCSQGLREHARAAGRWDGAGELDFAAAFSDSTPPPAGRKTPGREAAGAALLQRAVEAAAREVRAVCAPDLMAVLRDRPSGICMCGGGGFRTTGALVSVLSPTLESDSAGGPAHDVHWLTATPDPSSSCFKPFTFGAAASSGGEQLEASADTRAVAAAGAVNPPHALWTDAARAAAAARRRPQLKQRMAQGLADIERAALAAVESGAGMAFAEAVARERALYAAVLRGAAKDKAG
jgi:secernin